MKRFIGAMLFCCSTLGFAQSTHPTSDPTPESATRPNSERRSRAAEAIQVLGPVNFQNEADLQRVVEVVERQILGDSRLMPCDLHIQMQAGQTFLEGYCLLAEQKSAVLNDLRRVGADEVIDHVSVGSLGGDQPYARIENGPIHVTAKPDPRSEQLTEWPAGATLYLLQQQGNFFLALGPDGYAGFVEAARLQRISRDELKSARTNPTVSRRARSPFVATEDRQASLPANKTDGTNPSITGSAHAKSNETNPTSAAAADQENGKTNPIPPDHAPEIESAISSASQLLGTKYVWGGIDQTGVDCSGLTRCAFTSIGVYLPRDADQQALAGRLVAVRWQRDGLRRGDLLFFAGRRGTISHVAIYLGDQNFLEAADGKVQLSSFDSKSPNYRANRVDSFCLAKRILE